ncbi:DNA polymerase III subunit delta' [Desulfurivibrio alkaliphilus]|uniref:DNA polymerase III, delta prime subunit n=1 Tax=Desulfurivibrio alkaliphilus (strain DSM 19089 / UNIQEM U267 / AHT2) TaxID=589865 RepID=D6Z4U0_DESAT|nr:DNA polymerase III subunit delta' [Desulfurivibrio alkaliphilus]ADH86565.1 DNA polymerase III, delta prime subunit [Desulfurivibrio alkaliphilus AHT 2]
MLTTFSQIIEQQQAKEILRRAVGGGKLAHAYLFRGPAGVGKKTAARALAAALNCQGDRPEPLEACGRCPSCRKFASANHPDFLEIMPEGAGIKIQQVRELKKALQFPPLEAGRRVVVLGEVHTMRREAANSLLKTLEEPPADTILLLTGDEAGGILPTILSRCQIIPFYPLPVETLARTLYQEATDHRQELEMATDWSSDPVFQNCLTLATVAEGSLGRARQLQEQELLPLRRQVLESLLNLQPEAPAAPAVVLYWAERCAQLKEELPDFLDLLTSCYHDLALLQTLSPQDPANRHNPIINRDLLPLLSAAAAHRGPATLESCRQHLRRAQGRLRRNCNRTLVCEVLFFDLL